MLQLLCTGSAIVGAAAYTDFGAVDASPRMYTCQIKLVNGINDCARCRALAYYAIGKAITAVIVQAPQIWSSGL